MMFWIVAAALTAATVLALTRPLQRPVPNGGGADRGEAEARLSVYREPLAELERDRAGMTDEAYQAARTELARRVLEAGTLPPPLSEEIRRPAPRLALLLTLIIPAVTLALYLPAGLPDLPSAPYAVRGADQTPERIGQAIAALRAHLAAEPDDGEGWLVLGRALDRLGRPDEAREALSRALALAPPDAPWRATIRQRLDRENGAGAGGVSAEPPARPRDTRPTE